MPSKQGKVYNWVFRVATKQLLIKKKLRYNQYITIDQEVGIYGPLHGVTNNEPCMT